MTDPAALLVLRALAGSTGKVEIGGRRYSFSCIPAFRLRDEDTGQSRDCLGSAELLATILSLQRAPATSRVSSLERV